MSPVVPTIREAKPDEAGTVATMILALHIEVEQFGGMVRPGPKTSEWVKALVGRAIAGHGLALVVEAEGSVIGTLLATELDWPYDTEFERPVIGFGTYVLRDYRREGIADKLYDVAKRVLRERGFDAYFGAYLNSNSRVSPLLPRKGFVGYETAVVMRLKE